MLRDVQSSNGTQNYGPNVGAGEAISCSIPSGHFVLYVLNLNPRKYNSFHRNMAAA
jgi:hypothetical protein